MALAVVIAGLALAVVVALVVYRLSRRVSGAVGSAGLAIAALAVAVTLLAYPMERTFAGVLDQDPGTTRAGPNPSVDRPAQPPSVNEAWGPDRKMYTNAEPASGPVLNSIADNPNVGDERAFLVFKDAAITEAGHWELSGELLPGHTYLFRLYINAAGADDLNSADLRGVVARVRLPGRVGGNPDRHSSGTAQYCGFVESSNAQPSRIWSCGILLARQEIRLFVDPTSVIVYNNHFGLKTPQGPLRLGAELFTDSGQALGFDRMDGTIPAGYFYALYLNFKVKVEKG